MAKSKSKRSFNTNFKKAVKKDSQRQQMNQSKYGFLKIPDGVPIFKAAPGSREKFDIMPYIVTDDNHPDKLPDEGIAIEGEIWYKRPFKIHRGIGVDDDSVVCPKSVGKPCPICEYQQNRLREGAEYDEVSDLKTSDRNLYVVIPIGSDDYDEKPHIWEMSQYLFQNLLNTELEEDEDNAVFPSLDEGLTLKVRFDSQKIGNGRAFAEASRIDFYERDHIYDESILDDIPNLDECLLVYDYKELEAKFMQIDPADISHEEDEDEDEIMDDAEPKKRKKKPVGKKKKKKAEVEDEPEEETEEETPKPKKKKKKKKKAEVEDEPEEEAEEAPFDEDEEDEMFDEDFDDEDWDFDDEDFDFDD